MDLRLTKPLIKCRNSTSAGAREGNERVRVRRYSVGGRSLRSHGGRIASFLPCAITSLTVTAALAQAAKSVFLMDAAENLANDSVSLTGQPAHHPFPVNYDL